MLTHGQMALEEMRSCLSPENSPFDYSEERPDGTFLVVTCGAHFEIKLVDASGVAMPECGQCEGTGTTDAMGKPEECPVCDGTGRLAVGAG